MAKKRKPKSAPQDLAQWQLTPEFRAAMTVTATDREGDILTAQAHTLDALFNKLARLAVQPGNGANAERLLRLAFRAQAQCARTLEVLGNLKSPRVIVAQQANVTTGPQQVNNHPAQAREKVVSDEGGGGAENGQSKLLEAIHGERLDFGAQGAAGGANPPLEALGAVNRPQD